MTEPGGDEALAGGEEPRTAGALLRQARQSRGMHIAALAAAIKVSPRKLEALEADRYDELVDATFTRALAQAVCRALKVDAEPVLALLPQTIERGLHVSPGLNAPLRQRAVRRDNGDRPGLSRPVVWGSLGLLLAAALVYFLPPGLVADHFGRGAAPASAPSAASAPAHESSAPVPTTAASAAPSARGPAAAASGIAAVSSPPTVAASAAPSAAASASAVPGAAAAAEGGELVVRALAGPSWVEVQDARGKVLVSRLVGAGESVSLSGAAPLRVKIGNAAVTQLSFRGEPVPLARDKTVARLELK
jgi:cytoskeleton protein RodZ